MKGLSIALKRQSLQSFRRSLQLTGSNLPAVLVDWEVTVNWRLVNVTPIYKKGTEDAGKYRPVSLTLVPREGGGADYPEYHHMAHTRQPSDQKQPA